MRVIAGQYLGKEISTKKDWDTRFGAQVQNLGDFIVENARQQAERSSFNSDIRFIEHLIEKVKVDLGSVKLDSAVAVQSSRGPVRELRFEVSEGPRKRVVYYTPEPAVTLENVTPNPIVAAILKFF